MPIELKVPSVGESITEVVIGTWRKSIGESVAKDEQLVELESDKATFELPSPAAGVLSKILKKSGDTAAIGEAIGILGDAGEGTAAEANAPQAKEDKVAIPAAGKPPAAPQAPAATEKSKPAEAPKDNAGPKSQGVQKEAPLESRRASEVSTTAASAKVASAPSQASIVQYPQRTSGAADRQEKVVPMSPIRRRIAERLVEAQKNAALLTTFNEADMSTVMALRQKHRESFQQKYGVKLGFMSFFVKAVVEALSTVPQLNAEVRGHDIVYRNYFDIGVAIGGGKGLVVPVLRNAERLSFAEIERAIGDFGRRAEANQIKLEELQGGTFTISNGGVYGSLLSTPIVNPPQSGVLGMHSIQERAVVRNHEIVIRPMMYLALTYDHRIVDGREAVTFLKRICEVIEDPLQLLLEV